MKIGFSCRPFLKNYNNGYDDGISVYSKNLFNGLTKIGVNARTLNFNSYDEINSNSKLDKFYALNTVYSLVNSSYKLISDLDIYHATDYRILPMKCKVISTIYDAIPLATPSFANPKFRKFKNLILKNAVKNSNSIITISNHSAKEISKYYDFDISKIFVIYCGVDSYWLEDVSLKKINSTLEKRGLNSGYFLFVGILQPRKNIIRMIQAHDLLSKDIRKNRPLVIVGRKGWNCEEILNKMNIKIQKKELYWFSDVNTISELKDFYKGAGVFVYPSLFEGFGLPILEAFASGIPVLTSNVSCLPEISNGIGYEANPYDIDNIKYGMEYLLDTEIRLKKISEGRDRAKLLTWDKCVSETLKVYLNVNSEK